MFTFVLLGATWVASAFVVAESGSSVEPVLVAVAVAEFVWSTDPSFPGLATRTPTFLFFAPLWCVDAEAAAVCALVCWLPPDP
jgi:hypothetical protein